MNGFASMALLPLLLLGIANPSEPPAIESLQAENDVPLALDATSTFWRGARVVTMENDRFGKIVRAFVPKYARDGQRTICISCSPVHTKSCISNQVPTRTKRRTNFGTGTSRKFLSVRISTPFSATRSSKSPRKASGLIWTSTCASPTTKTGGGGTRALSLPLASTRRTIFGMRRCAFRFQRSINVLLLSAIRCASISS